MDINKLFSSASTDDAPAVKEKQKKLSLVSYLNTKPLIYGLEKNLVKHSFQLQKDVPSVCARRLMEEEVEIGIIPSIEYARAKGRLKIVPDLSIASKEAVNSVILFFNKDLKNLNTIAVDTSSRTSVALLSILLQEKYEIEAELIPMAPDLDEMLRQADAALIIGDKALHYQVDWPNKLDLAAEWFDLTGLPFVFAFWAGTESGISEEDVKALKESYELGKKNIRQICQSHAEDQPYDSTFYENYLNNNISYLFSEDEKDGLMEFYRYAFYYGLIEFIPELYFYGQ
jgi:predicted solute-binding protein